MRSIFVLLILVMIGLNGKGQSVTALPDSVLSQCCLEVTLLNGNVTTVDWVFVQYITRDGTGTKLFVEYAPNFGGIQWETQIRIQDDFDDVLERSKFIVIPFTVGSTDYGINRNWIANIEENTTTGGTWIYGRFGTPTKRKFSAVEDYETMKDLLLACRPRAIVVAENGLYTEGDTVRMGGFLIENTSITTEGFNWQMKDTLSSAEFGLDYSSAWSGDTTTYWARRFGSIRHLMQMGRLYYVNILEDTTGSGGIYSRVQHSWSSGNPTWSHLIFNPADATGGTMLHTVSRESVSTVISKESINPYYSPGFQLTTTQASIGVNENGGGYPGSGVQMGAIGYGSGNEFLFLKTKAVDDNTATVGQYLQLKDLLTGEVDFATIDLSAYLPIADTAAMLTNYPSTAGYGIIDAGKTWRADTTSPNGLATRLFAKTLPTSIIADRSVRSNGSNLVVGSWSDNLTRLQAQVPVQFQSVTTAGLPTGVTGYTMYNTTTNGLSWYQGSRWAYGLESTFNRGTATRVPFFDANGQVMDDANFRWNTSTGILNAGAFDINIKPVGASGTRSVNIGNGTVSIQCVNIGGTSSAGVAVGFNSVASTQGLSFGSAANASNNGIAIGNSSVASQLGIAIGDIATAGGSSGSVAIGRRAITTANGQFVMGSGGNNNMIIDQIYFGSGIQRGNSGGSSNGVGSSYTINGSGALGANFAGGNITVAGGKGTGAGTAGDVIFSTSTLLGSGSTLQSLAQRMTVKGNTGFVGIGTTTPSEQLHVNDDLRVGDSTRLTTTPAHTAITGLLTRDANGWVGLASLAGGLSYSGGVLTGANIYTADGTINTGRTVTLGGVNSDYLKINGTTNDKRLDFFTTDEGYNTDGDFRARSYGNGSQSNNGSYLYYGGNVYSTGTRSFSGSFTVGSDRSIAQGGASYFYTQVRNNSGGRIAEIREVLDSTGNSYNYLKYKTDGLNASGILHISGFAKGNESTGLSLIHANTPSFLIQTNFYNSSTKFDWLRIDNLDTDTTSNRISFYNGKYAFPNASPGSGDKVLQWSSGTPSFVSLSGISNGIYSGSATLANHTTRARVPDDGNLFFSQTYNGGADSSFFYFQNAGSGERYVGIGITDTASTGGASLIFGNGGIGDLSFELKATDALSGTARVRGLDGDLLLSSSAGNISLSADVAAEVQVVGLVRAKQEAYYEITSTSSPQTFSDTYSDNFVNQGSTQANFTFLFPASPEDGQILSMTWNNAISVLTLDGNGNTITGTAVTTAVAGTQRKFKFYSSTSTWIKIY